MEQNQDEGSRHVRTEDLLDAPPTGRALAMAGLAAIAGAAVWGLLRIYGGVEHGVVAWGIGGVIGFAIVKAGGHGQTLAIAGATMAVLAIAAGKQISYQSYFNEAVELMLEDSGAAYDSYRSKAEAWGALGESPSDEAVESFAMEHDIDVADAAELRSTYAPGLALFLNEQPTREEWIAKARPEVTASWEEEFTFMDYLRADFSIYDLLFIGLGLATAFGMVQKQTIELQREAREQIRAEREEANPPAEEE